MDSKEPQERQLGIFFCRLEYENLYNALQISLAQREDTNIKQITCLNDYFDLTGNKLEKLKFAQFVYSELEAYPSECRTGEVEFLLFGLLDAIALGHYESQNYHEAQKVCQKCSGLLQKLTSISGELKRSLLALNYHQLGIVAQELREFEQARQHYQQALQLKIEFGDRYSQARTYGQLGLLAEAEGNLAEARTCLQQALERSLLNLAMNTVWR